MRFQKPSTRIVCSNVTMTFKALLLKGYAEVGPQAQEVRGRGDRAPLEFFSPLDNLGPLLALGSNNKYSNKLIAKLKTETYNNERVSKNF